MGRFNVHNLGSHEEDLEFLTKVREAKSLDEIRALRQIQVRPLTDWRTIALNRAVKRIVLQDEGGDDST